jgi:hypothetical protein
VKRRSAGKTRELSPWRSGTNMDGTSRTKTTKYQQNTKKMGQHNPIHVPLSMSWLIFYSPFVRGMYFESEQRPAIIYTLFVFLLFWIYKWIKGEPTRFFRNKLDIALFALVAMYGLSFFWAVSKHDAIFEWLKYCMYFSVYYIISDIADTDKKKNVILWTILLAGLGLSIIGLDGMLGSKLGDFLNQYLKLPGSEQGIFFGTFVGGRINSTLQYPNSLAIYLIACFFISLILSDNIKKIYLKLFFLYQDIFC